MDLPEVSIALGAVLAALHAPLLLAPAVSRKFLAAFPRSRVFAWLLTAVDLAWSAWLLYHAPLGRFECVKDFLFILTPAAFFLVVFFMDELLAARALGGLLILVPAPLLNAARWHDSALRLTVVMLAYVLAIQGVMVVLSPYKFRKTVQRLAGNDFACRVMGIVGVAVGLLVLALGLTVF